MFWYLTQTQYPDVAAICFGMGLKPSIQAWQQYVLVWDSNPVSWRGKPHAVPTEADRTCFPLHKTLVFNAVGYEGASVQKLISDREPNAS